MKESVSSSVLWKERRELALDPFGSEKYPSHQVLLGNRIPILENLTNLKKIPVFSYIIGLANKIKDGSGSPIRIIALT